MHRIILKEKLDLPVWEMTMQAHVPYYIESVNLAAIAQAVDGKVLIAKEHVVEKRVDNPKTILVIRSGGAGDLLFLSPILRKLDLLYPSALICVACAKRHAWIPQNCGVPVETISIPLIDEDLMVSDMVLDMTDVIEDNPNLNAVDALALHAGVTLEDKKTSYIPSIPVREFDKPSDSLGRIAVQWSASSAVRTYPHTSALLKILMEEGYQVVLYHEPGPFRIPHGAKKLCINLPEAGLSWQENIDLLQTCDAVIGPDSSLIHFAGAMGKPAIGLYGSFDFRTRTIYQPTIHPIQSTGSCSPCKWHGRRGLIFPINCPSQHKGICQVLADIKPEHILKTLEEIL